MSKVPCFFSDKRSCEASSDDKLVFIIGSGSSEFEEDLKVVNEVLKGFGFEGYFALLSKKEIGLEVFCTKICSRDLYGLRCGIVHGGDKKPTFDDTKTLFDYVRRAILQGLSLSHLSKKELVVKLDKTFSG